MSPLASESWLRGAKIAGVSAASFGAINATASTILVGPRESLIFLFVFTAVSFLVFWPLMALGLYCAGRWVQVEPLPWLYHAGAQRPRWLLPAVVAGTIVAMFAVSILSLVLFPQVMEAEGPITEYPRMHLIARMVIAGTGFWEEALFRLALLFPLLALFGVRGVSRRSVPLGLVAAALLSGLVFAWAHLGNVTNGGDAYLWFTLVHKGLLVSGILAYVAWRWGLEPAALAHFGFDAIALAMA